MPGAYPNDNSHPSSIDQVPQGHVDQASCSRAMQSPSIWLGGTSKHSTGVPSSPIMPDAYHAHESKPLRIPSQSHASKLSPTTTIGQKISSKVKKTLRHARAPFSPLLIFNGYPYHDPASPSISPITRLPQGHVFVSQVSPICAPNTVARRDRTSWHGHVKTPQSPLYYPYNGATPAGTSPCRYDSKASHTLKDIPARKDHGLGPVDLPLLSPLFLFNTSPYHNTPLVQLPRQTRMLESSRTSLQPTIDEVFPPIHRMPVELLCKIFQLYLDDPIEVRRGPTTSTVTSTITSNSSPVILGHVCGYWRNVALFTPTLWSTIAISKPKLSQLPLIRLWIHRASTCPLSLCIFQYRNSDITERTATDQILSLFISVSYQWESINFRLMGAPYKQLLNLPTGVTGSLKSISLATDTWHYADTVSLWETLRASPTVRRVRWDSYPRMDAVPMPRCPTHIPWRRLTHIGLHQSTNLTAHEYLEILRGCNELVDLDISVVMERSDILPSTPVLLPKLRFLKIQATIYNPADLFDHVIVPALLSLDVNHCIHSHSPRPPFYIKDLLTRSGCHLENLSLWHGFPDEDEMMDLLAAPQLQSLCYLQVDRGPFTDRTIKMLTHSQTSRLLPHLKRMMLPNCEATDGILLDLVVSRLPLLEEVRVLVWPDESFPRDWERLHALRADGHAFKLSHTFQAQFCK